MTSSDLCEAPALPPELRTPVPGPQSKTWWLRHRRVAAPMGPKPPEDGPRRHSLVFSRGDGCNVWDVDENRFVDLAAGFGSLLLGHRPMAVQRALDVQTSRLWQAMGDVYPSDAKVGLLEQLCELYPGGSAQAILGQSGADAVSAALKTAALATGKPGVVAFRGAYHGLSYGPLAACGLRDSYRTPFAEQLNPHVTWITFPTTAQLQGQSLQQLDEALARNDVGAVLVEPILGRGGVRVLPLEFAQALHERARQHGALLVVDEIWTGLGRSGQWLHSDTWGLRADLVCLGKGLGGGLPISACLGSSELMACWSREAEVVHTSTFAGAPLACVTALATLDVLRRGKLVERARAVGDAWRERLRARLAPLGLEVRGQGLMLGVDLGGKPGAAVTVLRGLLERGYLSSTGGGQRETLVLTPPLTISEALLERFDDALWDVLQAPGIRLHVGAPE